MKIFRKHMLLSGQRRVRVIKKAIRRGKTQQPMKFLENRRFWVGDSTKHVDSKRLPAF